MSEYRTQDAGSVERDRRADAEVVRNLRSLSAVWRVWPPLLRWFAAWWPKRNYAIDLVGVEPEPGEEDRDLALYGEWTFDVTCTALGVVIYSERVVGSCTDWWTLGDRWARTDWSLLHAAWKRERRILKRKGGGA